MNTRLTLIRPDDWHLHVRDGDALACVVPHTARQMGRAVIMPNLKPPVTTVAQALEYRERVLSAIPQGCDFTPVMTLYLTENTSADEIRRAKESNVVRAVKLYPAGATTHSDAGVGNIEKVYPILEEMARCELPLLIHGEVTDPNVDVFDREAVFIERHLIPLIERIPDLSVVLEHITTADAVQFIESAHERVAATITAHHLLLNRNALFQGGIRPHHYCLPILKRETHRHALLQAAVSGNRKFFLGTDSAPHPRGAKETGCGCAGIYTAHAAIELYAEAFESVNALEQLEAFASFHGPDFYGLPRNADRITLVREPWEVPAEYTLGGDSVVPLRAADHIAWRLIEA